MTQRSPHIIQAPTGQTYPTSVACIALRSGLYPDPARPRCYLERLNGWSACGWFARDGRPYGLFEAEGEKADDLWQLLRRRARQKAPLWVVSSRACRDLALLALWSRCEEGAARLGDGCILGNPPTILSAFTPAQLIFLDSRNWSPWRPDRDMPTLARAYYLAEMVHGMVDTLQTRQWGSLRMTVGAQALWLWRYAHLRHSIVCHVDARALNLERAAYYGGRCEPMRLGHLPAPVAEMDVRSAYASACVERDVPCLLESVHGPMKVSALEWLLTKREVVADVRIVTSEPAYPCRMLGRVVWPTGSFRTVLSAPELRDAVRLHRIREVRSASVYRGFPALSNYMLEIYGLRAEWEKRGHKGLAGWAKSLLVCLPGALGRSDKQWRDCPWHEPRRQWEQRIVKRGGGKPQTVRTLAGKTEYEYNGGWAWNSLPAIAGWVTSAARVRLLEEIRCAGWANTHYVDTDCLYTNAEGLARLCPVPRQAGGQMGALELVGMHKQAWVGGAKHLILSGKVKMGGVYRLPEDQGPTPHDYYVPDAPSAHLMKGEMPVARSLLRRCDRVSGFPGRRLLPDGRMIPLEVWEDGTSQE